MKDANKRLLTLLCGCVLALLLVASARCSASEARAQTQMVQVPLSKLAELQNIANRQEQRLNQLQELLGGQSSTLTEQSSSISGLKQELQTAKSSLSSSELIISEQNKSLTSLSAMLKQEQRRMRRVERQRLLWQVAAGSVIVYAVIK